MGAPAGLSLAGVERIRWHRDALVAVMVESDLSRRIVRLELDAAGSAIARATNIEASLPAGQRPFVTIFGDDLLYVLGGSPTAAREPPPGTPTDQSQLVTYRVRLP
jgi:hypothetical protein